MNADYQVEEFMTGFVGFGSDGGGEMLAFDETGAVWKLPFVGYSSKEDAWKVADRWHLLLSGFPMNKKEGPFSEGSAAP
jgi:hypothetical protein